MKRRIALGFLAFLLLSIGGALWLVSSPWAGRKLCDLAVRKAREAAGLEVAFGSCRVRPLRLTVDLGEVRVGSPGKPVFAADSASVTLARRGPAGAPAGRTSVPGDAELAHGPLKARMRP